jgi:hypothetical protein
MKQGIKGSQCPTEHSSNDEAGSEDYARQMKRTERSLVQKTVPAEFICGPATGTALHKPGLQ